MPQGRSELGIHLLYEPTPEAPELHDLHRALGDLELVYMDAARSAGIEFAPHTPRSWQFEPYLPEELWLVWREAWSLDPEIVPGLTIREVRLRSPLELIAEIPTWAWGAGVGLLLGNIKRIWNLDVQWKADRWAKKADAQEARLRYERAVRARGDESEEQPDPVDPYIARRVRRSRVRPRQLTVFDSEKQDS